MSQNQFIDTYLEKKKIEIEIEEGEICANDDTTVRACKVPYVSVSLSEESGGHGLRCFMCHIGLFCKRAL